MQSTPQTTRRRFFFALFQPANVFLILGLVVGLAFCVFIPFNAGFDEETHMVRIFEMSRWVMIPNQSAPNNSASAPAAFFQLSFQRRYIMSPAFDLLRAPKISQKINWSDMYLHTTRAIYPPVGYFAQAIVAGIGWGMLDLPIVPVAIAARIVGLLMYVLGITFAIRSLPFGKWLLVILGLSPMALFTASTLNIDGFTTMTCIVFTSLVLKYQAETTNQIAGRQVFALLAAALAVSLARPGAFLLLPLVLVLPYRRFQSRRWLAALWGGILAAILLSLAWEAVILPKVEDGGLLSQITFVMANLFHFLKVFILGVFDSIPRYWREWVGVYGHWLGVVPDAVYWLFPIAILASLLAEVRSPAVTLKMRISYLAVFFIAAGGTCLIMYIRYYSGDEGGILGVQGRYFLPFAPLFFLAFAQLLPISQKLASVFRTAALGVGLLVLGLYSLGLGSTYYTNCGTSLYTGKECMQPVYKNMDKSGAPEISIKPDISVVQTFKNVCGPMNVVSVLIKSVPENPQGAVRFELLDESGKVISQALMPAADNGRLQYMELKLNPPTGVKGAQYQLRLGPGTTPPEKPLTLATSHTQEIYDGKLTINGVKQNADLIFHYYCLNPYVVRETCAQTKKRRLSASFVSVHMYCYPNWWNNSLTT